MPRCGCAQDQCSCRIVAGPGVEVTGSGTEGNPYQVGLADTPVSVDGGGTSRYVGEVIMYAAPSPPDSTWLACNGQAVSRAGYAALFAAIGTYYGGGDGTTTFNVPDFSDRSPMGTSVTYDRGVKVGAATATLSTAHLPSHTHGMAHTHLMNSGGTHDHSLDRSDAVGGSNSTIPKGTATISSSGRGAISDDGDHIHSINNFNGSTSAAGSASPTAVPTRTPSLTVPFYIKAV